MNPLYRQQFLLSVIFCKLYLRFYPPLSLFSRRRLNNEPFFAPLRTNKGSISLFKMIKHTYEVKDTFKFVYNGKDRAGLEVIELMKRLFGIRYPAFIGDRESLSVVDNVRLTVQLLFSEIQKTGEPSRFPGLPPFRARIGFLFISIYPPYSSAKRNCPVCGSKNLAVSSEISYLSFMSCNSLLASSSPISSFSSLSLTASSLCLLVSSSA